MAGSELKKPVSLSERELQIIELVATGLTNQEIAEKLKISVLLITTLAIF